jgi:hypothetical protein
MIHLLSDTSFILYMYTRFILLLLWLHTRLQVRCRRVYCILKIVIKFDLPDIRILCFISSFLWSSLCFRLNAKIDFWSLDGLLGWLLLVLYRSQPQNFHNACIHGFSGDFFYNLKYDAEKRSVHFHWLRL